jgi:hypothetical protein
VATRDTTPSSKWPPGDITPEILRTTLRRPSIEGQNPQLALKSVKISLPKTLQLKVRNCQLPESSLAAQAPAPAQRRGRLVLVILVRRTACLVVPGRRRLSIRILLGDVVFVVARRRCPGTA